MELYRALYFVQVGQTRTCFSFIADRWYPVANTSIDHLIKIQEYAETGNVMSKSLVFNSRIRIPRPVKWKPFRGMLNQGPGCRLWVVRDDKDH